MTRRRLLGAVDEEKATQLQAIEYKKRKVSTNMWKLGARNRLEMLRELKATMGNITESLKRVGVTRGTYKRWLKENPEFAEQVEMIFDMQIDFAEQALFDQIGRGNASSTQFFLKTRGRSRGYQEKTEHKETRDINVNFSYETVQSEKLEQVQEIMEAQVLEQTRKLEDGEL